MWLQRASTGWYPCVCISMYVSMCVSVCVNQSECVCVCVCVCEGGIVQGHVSMNKYAYSEGAFTSVQWGCMSEYVVWMQVCVWCVCSIYCMCFLWGCLAYVCVCVKRGSAFECVILFFSLVSFIRRNFSFNNVPCATWLSRFICLLFHFLLFVLFLTSNAFFIVTPFFTL